LAHSLQNVQKSPKIEPVILTVPQTSKKDNKMTKSTFLTTTIAALFLITLSVNSGFAEKDNEGNKTDGTQTEKSSKNDSGGHMSIDTGKEFSEHVRDHNDSFSGDHNPGKHQGFSGVKSN
jgi:hypothetical protein